MNPGARVRAGRRGWRRLSALALLGMLPMAVLAQASSPAADLGPEPGVIRWMVRDVPPHFAYVAGRPPQRASDLGNGEVDGYLRLLIQHMPQYRHEFLDAGFPRFEALVRQGQTLCSPLHVNTPERQSWLYFTHVHPALISRQLVVVTRRELAPRFEKFGRQVPLGELLQSELVGLLPRDRSYGPKVDAALQGAGPRAPKTVVTGRQTHLLAMLLAQRMDYTLDYASAVDEYLKSVPQAPGELVKLPLLEGVSTALATYACSRTPEGRKQIEAIDQAARKLAADPQREAWIQAWRGAALDDSERQRLKRYLDERARGGPQID